MEIFSHRFRHSGRGKAVVVILTAALLPTLEGLAETFYSDPVGVSRLEVPSGSDRIVSIPYERATAGVESAGAVVDDVITVSGLPGWMDSQFVYNPDAGQTDTYYLRFTTGAKSGRYYTVIANGTDSVTVFPNGDVLVGNADPDQDVASGDSFKIIPYWTLDTVFPDGDGITASASVFSRATEILFADSSGTGINKAPGTPYYFYDGAWRNTASGLADRGDDAILPDTHFTIRQNSDSTITHIVGEAVPMDPLAIVLATRSNTSQDNPISLARPSGSASDAEEKPYAGVSLDRSGLYDSGAITPGTSPFRRGDEVLVYENTAPGMNHAPSKIYYHYNGAWRRVGAPVSTDVGGELVFVPGGGVIIRKAATGSDPSPSTVWLNNRDYLNVP